MKLVLSKEQSTINLVRTILHVSYDDYSSRHFFQSKMLVHARELPSFPKRVVVDIHHSV